MNTTVKEYQDAKRNMQKLMKQISDEFDAAIERNAPKEELDMIMLRYNMVRDGYYRDFPV